jgi:hypothetical protein
LGVKRPCREANPSNEVKSNRRCTSSPTICLCVVVHRDSFARLFVAWLPAVINSLRPSTAVIALSFTFCLHTLPSRFFQMLEERSRPSFCKVVLRSIIILRDFCCCYRKWKISLFVCSCFCALLVMTFLYTSEKCAEREIAAFWIQMSCTAMAV